MNWFTFAVFAWLAVGLDAGLADVFQLFAYPITPSFATVLLVFVCVWAPPKYAYAAVITIGLAQDFFAVVPMSVESTQEIVVLGPHALGATLGASLVINLRSVMFKRSALSIFVLTFFASMLIEITVISTLAIRSIYPNGIFFPSPSKELLWGKIGRAHV